MREASERRDSESKDQHYENQYQRSDIPKNVFDRADEQTSAVEQTEVGDGATVEKQETNYNRPSC